MSVCLCSVSRWTGAGAGAAALCVGAADLASPRASAIDATLCAAAAAAANPPPTANPPQAGAVQTAATNKRRNGPTTTRRHTGQTGRQLHLKDPPPHTASPIVGPQMDIYDDFFCQMLHLPNHPTDAKYLSEKAPRTKIGTCNLV